MEHKDFMMNFIKLFIYLEVPLYNSSQTGYHQPIHFSQLSKLTYFFR